MPIYYKVAQYSEAYDHLKLGIPTSSHFHKIITPQGKPSKQWREYACLLIAERLLQQKIDIYHSPAMERGLIVEAEAADWYEFDQDVTVQRVGFITDDDHTIGCSPDRLVGDDGLLEIKALYLRPRSNTGFLERSTSGSGLSCKANSTSPSAAGSISCAGTTCFLSW
jgi:YqaJ-like viral recombinase domain